MCSELESLLLHLSSLLLFILIGCATCYKKKKNPYNATNEPAIDQQQKSLKSTASESRRNSSKLESSERLDSDAVLGIYNPQIQAVLAEPPGDEVSDDYMAMMEAILDTADNYMWSMRKHMSADEAAWRELAKRITILHAEGYDVRAGTKEARQRRQRSTDVSLLEKVTKKRKKKKKRKQQQAREDEG